MMFLTGSLLLIFLTGGLTSSPSPLPDIEDTVGFPGTVETKEYPAKYDDYLPIRIRPSSPPSGGLTSSPSPLPDIEDTVGFPGTVETEKYNPEYNNKDAALPNGFIFSLPPDVKDTQTFPGIKRIEEYIPKNYYNEIRREDVCGLRGHFDGSEFDDIYRLDRTSPPEYLKEYFASFYNIPGPCDDRSCNYDEIIQILQLEQQKEKLTRSRPINSHRALTYVYLEMVITAILNVKENDQLFIAHVWLYMSWNNHFIFWNPEEFCGIEHIIVSSDTLWKPDIIIEEMLEKDKISPSPFVRINSFGEVEHRIDQVVTGTCRMNVYKFPFDVQQCTLSFKSLMYSDDEIRFVVNTNTTVVSKWAHYAMQSQHEWLFVKIMVRNKTTSYYFGSNQTVIIYSIFMQRRAILHFVNFLMPIFFFLCMDLASFLIPDSEGEKISFRITVLLAVTVLQLILHEILPCSSDKVPLIAIYCTGIFFMMLLSLLEAILARHLIQKDSETQDCQTTKGSKSSTRHSSLCYTVADNIPSETKETNSEKPSEVYLNMKKAADELEKDSDLLRKDEEKPGYWTGRVKSINRGFFILYLTTATVFLIYMFTLWTAPDED